MIATGADTTAYEQHPPGDGPPCAARAPDPAGGERHPHHRAPGPGGGLRGRGSPSSCSCWPRCGSSAARGRPCGRSRWWRHERACERIINAERACERIIDAAHSHAGPAGGGARRAGCPRRPARLPAGRSRRPHASTCSATASPPAARSPRRVVDAVVRRVGRHGRRDRRRRRAAGCPRRRQRWSTARWPTAWTSTTPTCPRCCTRPRRCCPPRWPWPRPVGASGTAMLDAAAVGIEVTCRLGMAGYDEELGNSVFFEHGQHATAICGAVGAAVAAGDAARAGRRRGITSAIGIAASMGAGIIEANRTGGTSSACTAAGPRTPASPPPTSRAHGLTGPPTVLEGRFGFLQAFCGDRAARRARSPTDSASTGRPRGVFFKPYPCNHFTHAGIDAALRDAGRRESTGGVVEASTLGVARARPADDRRAAEEKARAPLRATTPPSAGRTPSPRPCSAAAGSACSTTTSPTQPRPTPPGWRSPRGCAAWPTTESHRDLPAPVPRRAHRASSTRRRIGHRAGAGQPRRPAATAVGRRAVA